MADKTEHELLVAKVATEFVSVLKRWLSTKDFAAMKAINAEDPSGLCCASHDYCDANMAMDEAINTANNGNMISDDDANTLWNDAWAKARKDGLV